MEVIQDYQGMPIRFTEERRQHILEHPEMIEMFEFIEETLSDPEKVVESIGDPKARLYYRYYLKTCVGGKFLCVVVKCKQDDAFVLTAYLTDKAKKGKVLWTKKI